MEKVITLTDKRNGKTYNIDEAQYSEKCQLHGEAKLNELYSIKRVIWKTYKFQGWVHSKRGGDDYDFEMEIKAETEDEAKELLLKWLKRRSSVLTDWKLIH